MCTDNKEGETIPDPDDNDEADLERQLPAERNNPLDDWLVFTRRHTLKLQQTLKFQIPTMGGKALWSDRHLHISGRRVQENVLTRRCRLLDSKDNLLFWGTFDECLQTLRNETKPEEAPKQPVHLVLCLHGIFRSRHSLTPMAKHLTAAGYVAHGINYPSTFRSIQEHAGQVTEILNQLEGVDSISFVAHSMGGLIARAVLSDPTAPWRSRLRAETLVMIASPNQGAHLARELSKTWAFRLVAGPSGLQLTPEWVENLAKPNIPFGIIAGGKGDGRGYNPFLSGDDDLTVSVESTHLDGAADFLLVPAIHSFIMRHPAVLEATQLFLSTHRFRRDESTPPQSPSL